MGIVKVGPKETKFMVARSLLRRKSDFFEVAFRPDSVFPETTENVVRLPEEEPLFDVFVKWVYKDYHTPKYDPSDVHATGAAMRELVALFGLGGRLGAVELQKEMAEKLFTILAGAPRWTFHFPSSIVRLIYSLETPTAYTLKTMTVDHYIWGVDRTRWADADFDTLMTDLPEFARDCMKKLGQNAMERKRTGKAAENPFKGLANHYLEMFEA